jgi:hypothetical protein
MKILDVGCSNMKENINRSGQIKIQQTGIQQNKVPLSHPTLKRLEIPLIYQLSKIRNRGGQLKIQQMAFVLVALMIFFVFVFLIYFTFKTSSLEKDVISLKEEEARELVKKLSGSSEFAFSVEDCSNCVDFDKVLILSERRNYEGFWGLDYLEIEKVYPKSEGEIECTRQTYPVCSSLKIIDSESDRGSASSAFVSLCRWEEEKGGYFKCEIGRLLASGEGIR